MTGTTWDPANKSSLITLGRSNIAAATNAAAATWKGVRATTSLSSGKKYYELYVTGYGNDNGWLMGMGNSSFSTASFAGGTINSFGYQSTGNVYNVTGGSLWQGCADGYVVGVAVDLGNKLFWAKTDRDTN